MRVLLVAVLMYSIHCIDHHIKKSTLDPELHVGKVEEVVDVLLAGVGVRGAVDERLPLAASAASAAAAGEGVVAVHSPARFGAGDHAVRTPELSGGNTRAHFVSVSFPRKSDSTREIGF